MPKKKVVRTSKTKNKNVQTKSIINDPKARIAFVIGALVVVFSLLIWQNVAITKEANEFVDSTNTIKEIDEVNNDKSEEIVQANQLNSQPTQSSEAQTDAYIGVTYPVGANSSTIDPNNLPQPSLNADSTTLTFNGETNSGVWQSGRVLDLTFNYPIANLNFASQDPSLFRYERFGGNDAIGEAKVLVYYLGDTSSANSGSSSVSFTATNASGQSSTVNLQALWNVTAPQAPENAPF